MAALEKAKHEMFVQKWHELDNKSEAYRLSHPASLRWKEATVNSKASTLSKDEKILARYKELQAKLAARHFVTLDTLLEELQEAREIALQAETPQASAAVSATMSKAKLMGLDIQKIEHSGSTKVTTIDLTASPEDAARMYAEMMEGK